MMSDLSQNLNASSLIMQWSEHLLNRNKLAFRKVSFICDQRKVEILQIWYVLLMCVSVLVC